MLETILRQIFANQWIVIGVAIGLLLAATELGFRYGLRVHWAKDEAHKGQIGGIQGAILGLLGLLLGFTFAMAVGRYEARRELVLQEANAIGTTYLRAGLLPAAHQSEVERLLRQYVDARLDFYSAGEDPDQQLTAEQKAADLQRQLWSHAVAAAKESPTPLVASFITSLNETIDLDAARMNALRNHVPGAVWLLVLAIAICGCSASGYAAGTSGARGTFANWVLPVLIAVVVTLIADLDRPGGGLITIKQTPMIDLKQSLKSGLSPIVSP